MGLTITVRLRNGRYEAGVRRGAEWPPQPARVFCALVASAESESDWQALRWLESQQPPQVLADPAGDVKSRHLNSYVVENAPSVKHGSQEWIGRTNGMRARAWSVPATDSFAITWPEAAPPAQILGRLQALAFRVPYIGRSTSLAEVTAAGGDPVRQPGWVTYEATSLDDRWGRWQLAVPYPGYTDALADAYADGRRSWEVAKPVAYRQARAADGTHGCHGEQAGRAAGPFGDLVAWGLATPDRGLDGGQAVALTQALRAAVMARVPDPLPPQLTGHGADDDTHLAYLAVPDTGHQHADGHLVGLAIAVPRSYPDQDQLTLLRSVLTRPLAAVTLPGGHELRLRYGADLKGLQPGTWTGGHEGARTWVTATPMRLNGYLRRGRDVAEMVSRALVCAGYPEPASVVTSSAPMMSGAVWRARPATLPANRKHYPFTHARVTFSEHVTGPVISGSMRYLGLGLFLPVADDDQERAHGGQRERSQVAS
jgi:CRISPR-associated protein Csb2